MGFFGKGLLLAITAGAVVFAAGCGNGDKLIDRKEALEFALADAELTGDEVKITRQQLEKGEGREYYEIAFTSNGYSYAYEIDASSGAVTGVGIEALSGEQADGGGNQPEQPAGQEGSQAEQGSSGSGESGGQESQGSSGSGESGGQESQGGSGSGESGGQQGQAGQVDTMDSAKAIALADAGLTDEEVTFTKEKLDWDDGVAVYDIDFHTADREYEYEINAATGVIMDRSEEVFRKPGGMTGTDSLIGEEKAKETAVAHAGFSMEEVFFTKVKLEEEDGRMEYEIEFYKDRIEYEVTIDAAAGTVLEYESEYED